MRIQMWFSKEYKNSKLAGFMVKNSFLDKDKLGVKFIISNNFT